MREAATPLFHSANPDALRSVISGNPDELPASSLKVFQEKRGTLLTEKTGQAIEYFIHIPDGVIVSEMMELTWAPSEFPAATHLVLIVGKGAKASLVERLGEVAGCGLRVAGYSSSGSSDSHLLWTHSVEVFLEEGAELEFVSEQVADSSITLTIKQRSQLQSNAKISWRNVTLGGKTVDHDLQSALKGVDAVSAIDWMFYAKGQETYRLDAKNSFDGRRGGGEIVMKGVAEEKGHVRASGMIEIGLGGGQTDTYLTQDVLMLDRTAKVDAIPGLEIKTNDVKASHSATVSRVTEADLFYFAARGIAEREARRMFVEGFLGEVVGRMRSASVRDEVLRAVEGKYRQ